VDMATIQVIVIIGGFAITLAAFLFTRLKEAENRGRLMQRVDQLEKIISEIQDRTQVVEKDVSCHESDLTKVTTEIEGLKRLVEKIDKKLDDYFTHRDGK
jgi:septal ring factor EnvC (AmiA/AmiB activator)